MLVVEIWRQKLEHPTAAVAARKMEHSGESVSRKLTRVGDAHGDSGCDATVINALDQICWLFNIQGCDIECCPVCYAYAVVTRTRDADGNCVRATLYLRWFDESGTEPKAASVVHEHLRSEGCVTADDESSSPIGVSV